MMDESEIIKDDRGMWTTKEAEDALIWSINQLKHKLMRPLYVFTMAYATKDRPGARLRMLRAAREIREIVEQ